MNAIMVKNQERNNFLEIILYRPSRLAKMALRIPYAHDLQLLRLSAPHEELLQL